MSFDPNRLSQLLKMFNEIAPIVKTFGMRLSFPNNAARIDLPYNPNLDHAVGSVHGGVYATMIDNAGWFIAAANTPLSTWVATSDLSIRYLEPVTKKALYSIGNIIKKGKRLIIAEMKLYDETGLIVGTGTGSFAVLKVDSRLPT